MEITIKVPDSAINCQHAFDGITLVCKKCTIPMSLYNVIRDNQGAK